VTSAQRQPKNAGPPPAAVPRRRLRLAPDERRAQIVDHCIEILSERGLAVSTRDICKPLGITQALLYRYFPSRQALIDAALERVFAHLWTADWSREIETIEGDLAAKLTAFYTTYAETATEPFMRLFMWCALSGYQVPRRFAVPLTDKILRTVVGALRGARNLPTLGDVPMMHGERELALTLHTGVVFLAIRRHIYRWSLPSKLGDIVALQVRTYLPGALDEIVRLHSQGCGDAMAVRVLEGPSARGTSRKPSSKTDPSAAREVTHHRRK
jgi:AcrR family transcriptional regulator